MTSLRILRIIVLFVLLTGDAAIAQPWPTTEWVVNSEDGEPLTGDRATGAEVYRGRLQDASAWYEAVGYPAPEMIRVGDGAHPQSS